MSPNYFRIFATFVQNSLIREMTFRTNFVIETVTRIFWFSAQITMFNLIYANVHSINGWSRYEFFAFMATGMIVNTLIEALFMPNCASYSELVRTGNLDFILLKPVDTQFLISFEKLELGELTHLFLCGGLLGHSLWHLGHPVSAMQVLLYLLLVLAGVAFFYSLMIVLASSSVWLGRNQGLYDFWFYITIFARYPRSIYVGNQLPGASLLLFTFSWIIPILLVITVPAEEILGRLKSPTQSMWLLVVTPVAAMIGLVLSRWFFYWSLRSYRSASS